jgi:uncharacterized protein (TIGR03437 family)
MVTDRELVRVTAVAPELFTADACGKGAPAGLTAPVEIADTGAYVVLYGTGLRHSARRSAGSAAGGRGGLCGSAGRVSGAG